MPDGISMREFGRREGCSHTAVQKAIRAGDLKAMESGKLDPALVGTAWRRTERQAPLLPAPAPLPEPLPGESLAEAAQRLLENSGEIPLRAVSERKKEHFLALLRQLEFQTKSRAVFARADVDLAVDEAMQIFRSNLEGIAGRLSAELAGISNPAVIKDRLSNEHHRVLHACADRLERAAADAAPDGAGAAPRGDADSGPVGERGPRAAGRKRRAGAVPK